MLALNMTGMNQAHFTIELDFRLAKLHFYQISKIWFRDFNFFSEIVFFFVPVVLIMVVF